jgi:ATP-dependent DNA helicase RecG
MSPIRSTEQLARLVHDLLQLPSETEWIEDKVGNADPGAIGEYISALANGAALAEQDRGYLIWGAEDGTRRIVGTEFTPKSTKVGGENLQHWLIKLLDPQVHFTFHEVPINGSRVVLLEIDRAVQRPVTFKREAYLRVTSYKKKLRDYPEVAQRLWRSFVLGSFESGLAADGLDADDVLRLLDYPTYFRLMKVPLPDGRAGILERLSAEKLITKDPTGYWNITNLGAILFALEVTEFPSLRRKAVRVIHYRGNSRVAPAKEQEGVHGYASGFKV